MDDDKAPRPAAPLGPSERRVCPNPECEYDKHAKDANFCILCGTLLYRRCDDCAVANPRYARFCFYCGTDLDELRSQSERREESAPPPFALPKRDLTLSRAK